MQLKHIPFLTVPVGPLALKSLDAIKYSMQLARKLYDL